MTTAVEIDDVFRVYATEEGTAAALQGLSLRIREGEIVAVLGPSGSGSSPASTGRPPAGFGRSASISVASAGGDSTGIGADCSAMRISATRKPWRPS
jgi:ABC-type dipeptide/oligopeptide/nickel transport system ATPase subunit